MKIGQVEFTWRAHRQACVVKIGGEQRVFRFNKKTTRKELFAKIRSLIAEAAGTQKVCQHCGKHYFGVNSHNFLCGDCAQKAADIHREGVGNIKEFSFSEALQYIPEGVNPIEYERKIDAEIRAERQALVDLWKQDGQAWNLYCYGKRASK
jgi:Zn finger protein HypA/HybF involved in hydrogenase expression